MCRTRFLLVASFSFSSSPATRPLLEACAKVPAHLIRGSGRPARFSNFSYFWVVMCLPTAMRAQLLAFRVALAMPPAPRVKVYGLFGIRSVHPRPCTHDPTPQPAASRPAWFCEISEHRSTAIKRKPCIKYRPPPVQVLVYTGTLFKRV